MAGACRAPVASNWCANESQAVLEPDARRIVTGKIDTGAMPIHYSIDENRRVIFIRVWGELNDDVMLAEQRRAREDPAFDPGYDQFLDLSQIESLRITSRGVAELVGASRRDPDAKRAFVAPTDVLFGMARMSEIMLDDAAQQIAVFRTADEARAWLGLGEGDATRRIT